MKKSVSALILAMVIQIAVGSFAFAQGIAEDRLTVYAYDSFLGDWGAGEPLAEQYLQKTGRKVNLVSCSGAVQMYSRILFEGTKCPADIVIGLSDTIEVQQGLLEPYSSSTDNLIEKRTDGLIPFDYGIFCFIADTQAFESGKLEEPTCLEDLTKDCYRNKVILIDPRTSSVGLGLLEWTIEALGEEKAFEWWKSMKDNALTIADSWSSAYGLFTEGEAPLVISYTTSPVYHVMYENTTRFKALEFTDGHIMCTEYMGILGSSERKEEAADFIEFILNEGQLAIANANTMFPANKDTALPEAYDYALVPEKMLNPDRDMYNKNINSYLSKWAEIMVR